jgi:hypothetical protein
MYTLIKLPTSFLDRRGHARMVVGFTTTYAISAYHHCSSEFEFSLMRGVLNTTLCDKGCQWLVTGRWFSPGTPVFFTNKTDHHHITEILLKKALNIITLTLLISFCKSTRKHRMSFYITWNMMTISIYNTTT